MDGVSVFRLYILRALYLFVVIGLGAVLWPNVIDPNVHWTILQGQSSCMLAAFSLCCLIGLRFPLQMLPVLLWEVIWKTLWLALVPLPQWLAGHLDDALKPSVFACSLVVLVYIAIPWDYVYRRYVRLQAGSPAVLPARRERRASST